ncbi:MAG: hybrid sensor histidine kinase/response regulator [Gammaproteobacteria bacterium]
MPQQNDELLKRLLNIFRIEADEHLKMLSSGVRELEKKPADTRFAEIVEKIFREAHSLKGAARAVNLKDIELVCQSLESVFSAMKSKRLSLSQPLIELLYQTIDLLTEMTASDHAEPEHTRPMGKQLIHRLEEAVKGRFSIQAKHRAEPELGEPAVTDFTDADEETPASEPAKTPSSLIMNTSETIRVSAQKFDIVMRQVEELLSPRLAVEQRGRELNEIAADLARWKKQQLQVRPVLRMLDRYVNSDGHGAVRVLRELHKLLEYMESETVAVKTLEDRLQRVCRANEYDKYHLGTMIDNLLDNVKEMYLLPFSSVLEVFPRFVRELARDQGKQVELTIQGSEIEIDRRILEEMKDPLIHLLRNAVDHGLELPALRHEKGKRPQGSIGITIAQKDSGKVEILITDDGAGIDANKVKDAACKLGKVSAGDAVKLTESDIQTLIFHSGISTSPIITDVSGRGLGLAIVQEKVEKLGGVISLESSPGLGTAFRIILPLAMASIRGLLVAAGERLFVIPAMSVEQVLRIAPIDIQTVENRETILLDGQAVSLVWLSDVLQLPRTGMPDEISKVPVVVLAVGAVRIAYRLDSILGEQEAAVRPLGRQLVRVRNVGGASVLGNGQVVPVLNVPDLLKSAVKRDGMTLVSSVPEKPLAVEKKAILVVEDSITSRVLIRNILESAGYQVSTAIDGVDAYMALKTGSYDLVVSDVEMPRMDGFTLTAKVRSDKKLEDLPIVLVTALESSEHRERGIDVGANAYIVKSSFDQSNLLEVVGRLV